MRCTIPEISWHNRDPVLSIDIQPQQPYEDFYRLASSGTDSHVIVWYVEENDEGGVSIEAAADLVRHQKAVNAVRFSPCGKFLASGDDEAVIMIWKQRQDTDAPDIHAPDSEAANKESWTVFKILRGHLEDVYDLCWSPDSTSLISGSVDNTAILWDIQKGTKVILSDHKGFVQGVTWDPKGQYVATLGSDRKLRVYSTATKKLSACAGKALLPVPKGHELEGKNVNLFHDDTIQTFFRRLCFSPDGEMIIAPSGVIESTEPGKKPSSTTLVFSRRLLSRPVSFLPSLDEYSVCVRCCPVLFELRNLDPSTKPESMYLLPYRIVFAVATACAVVLYDTQQPMPFGYISNLHYTRLTDLAWSPKGDMLLVSSTDGYCSIITFTPGELGVQYNPNSSPATGTTLSQESTISTGRGGEVGTDLEREVMDSSDGVACIQLSQDNVSGVPTDGSDLGLTKLQSEKDETQTFQPLQEKLAESGCLKKCDLETANEESLSSGCKSVNSDSANETASKLHVEEKQAASNTCQPQSLGKVPEDCGKEALNEEDSSVSHSQSQIPNASTSDKDLNKSTAEEEMDPQKSCQTEKVVTPSNSGKKARRVQLITLSSPKSRKKLL